MNGSRLSAFLRCGSVLVVATVWSARAFAGTDPTPAQIVSDWNTVSGGLTAKVVYWESDEIRVMDLNDGSISTVLSGITRSGSETAVGPYPSWSPDGTRILFYAPNGWSGGTWKRYGVVDEGGTNLKEVSATPPWTYGCCSWWDDTSVVVQDDAPEYIVRVTIDASNSPVGRQTLIDFAPYGGNGREWVSGNGGFVAWTDWGANPGGNRCVVRNVTTGQEMETCIRDEDCCTVRLKEDGSGTSVYCHETHYDAETRSYAAGIIPAGTLIDDDLLRPQGIKFEMPNWANHPDYMCCTDDRQYSDATLQKAYIIKLQNDQDTGEFLFLGWGMWGADVWIEPSTVTVTSPNGGETLTGKASETVTWTSQGAVGDVKIEISTNGGSSWTTLVASTPNDGTQSVTLPDAESTQCLVKVSETDGSPSDVSDGAFTIVWADTDSDGMPDWWEEQYFGSPTGANPGGDADSDGLNNLEEYQENTNPQEADTDSDGLLDGEEVQTYSTSPIDPDSDNDGLSDGDEVNTYLTDPTDSDSDDDGWSDGDELDYGTDPLDKDSHPSHPFHGMEGGCASGGVSVALFASLLLMATAAVRRRLIQERRR